MSMALYGIYLFAHTGCNYYNSWTIARKPDNFKHLKEQGENFLKKDDQKRWNRGQDPRTFKNFYGCNFQAMLGQSFLLNC